MSPGIDTPAAIVVSGPPASGKTTLATALAARLRYAVIDLDVVTGPLTREALWLSAVDEAAIDGPAGERLRAARYDTLLAVADANLAIGMGVVLAAPFTAERSSPSAWADLARRLRPSDPDHDVTLVYVDVPAPELRRRLQRRRAPRDRAKLQRSAADLRSPRPVPSAVVVDGTCTVTDQIDALLEALARLDDLPAGRHRAPSC